MNTQDRRKSRKANPYKKKVKKEVRKITTVKGQRRKKFA